MSHEHGNQPVGPEIHHVTRFADLKNGMLHVSKTVQFNMTAPNRWASVFDDLISKTGRVEDNNSIPSRWIPLSVKVVADLPSLR